MLAMLCFAGMDAISKWLVADYAVSQMMWIRYGAVLPVRLVRRAATGPARGVPHAGGPGLQVVRSLGRGVIEGAIFVLAFRYLPLADTHAIAATSPLIVIALGVLFLGERAGLARWLAVAAGFVGRAADRAAGLPHLRLAAAAAAGRRLAVGRLSDPDAALRPQRPARHHAWSGRRSSAFVATSFVGPFEWQWPTPAAWALLVVTAADRRGRALRADQGARLRRGGRRAALQLHAAGLGHDPGLRWCSATCPTTGRSWARRSSWQAGSTPGTTTGARPAQRGHCPEATSPPSIGSMRPVTQRDSSEAR